MVYFLKQSIQHGFLKECDQKKSDDRNKPRLWTEKGGRRQSRTVFHCGVASVLGACKWNKNRRFTKDRRGHSRQSSHQKARQGGSMTELKFPSHEVLEQLCSWKQCWWRWQMEKQKERDINEREQHKRRLRQN